MDNSSSFSSKLKSYPSIIGMLFLVVGIGVTTYLVQQQQITQNFAAEQRAKVGTEALPPKVTITSPSNGEHVSADTTINVAILNAVEVAGVEMYIDGAQVATLSKDPFIFPLPPTLAPGNHTVMVRAYDADSRVSTQTITISK